MRRCSEQVEWQLLSAFKYGSQQNYPFALFPAAVGSTLKCSRLSLCPACFQSAASLASSLQLRLLHSFLHWHSSSLRHNSLSHFALVSCVVRIDSCCLFQLLSLLVSRTTLMRRVSHSLPRFLLRQSLLLRLSLPSPELCLPIPVRPYSRASNSSCTRL